MTCSGCQAKVQGLLSKVNGVNDVIIDLPKGEATISMDKHVPAQELKEALADYPKYQLSEMEHIKPAVVIPTEENKSWLETYKPILVVFGYILGASLVTEWNTGNFDLMRWMQHFMAGFFLVFSFFKMLDLKGFAESYAMYDIVAKKWSSWGLLYAFIELALGIAFLTGFAPVLTNTVTLVVMSISIVGVLQSVMNKRKIRCACLGAVFNLPMSTVTIIEDALMIAMSLIMLITLISA
jgi:copper chaperone CopZ